MQLANIWYLFTNHGIESLLFLLLAFLLGLWWAYLHWFANDADNPAVQESEKLRRRKRELELRRDTLKAKARGDASVGATASAAAAGTSSAASAAKAGDSKSSKSAATAKASGAKATDAKAGSSSSASGGSSASAAKAGSGAKAGDSAKDSGSGSAWEKLESKDGKTTAKPAASRSTLTTKAGTGTSSAAKPAAKSSTAKSSSKPSSTSKPSAKPSSSASAKKPAAKRSTSSAKASPAIAAAVEKQFKGEKVRVDDRLGILYEKAPSTVDDLKKIKGVGKVIETKLHDFGVYRFKQIANWKRSHVEAFTEELATFKDRIDRDEWIKQAKDLAKATK